MKKYGIGSRVITVLLVLAMIVSMIPLSIWAAVGDIATDNKLGYTGLNGNVNTQDTISWPIKIFDYLNDGMLFEYPNAGDSYDISDYIGGAYGGGTPAPHFGYRDSDGNNVTQSPQIIVGTDYTVDWGYGEKPYSYWLSSVSMFTSSKAKVEAVNFKSPRHLRLVPYQDYTGQNMRPWVMSDFVNDNGGALSKDKVRYAVIVYRTSGLEEGKANLALACSTNYNQNNSTGTHLLTYQDGSTGVYYTYSKRVDIVANSDTWNYLVVDLKTGPLGDMWSSFSTVRQVLVDFAMEDKTDSVDISHVAYFPTAFEATEFGKDAVAFDNDPGEFLDAHTEYYPEGTTVPVTKPTTDVNGFDFSQYGASDYSSSTYTGWKTATSGLSYIGTVNGVKVNEVDNGERSYVQVSNSNNASHRGIYLWSWSGGGSRTALRYVTIVYKTTGFTADQQIGFFVRASDGGGANLTTGGISSVGSASQATLKQSNDQWTYITYDLTNIAKSDSDYYNYSYYTQYGLYLPACLTGSANAGKSLDIAFVQFQDDSAYAKTYGQQGADYMNGVSKEVSGSYTTPQKKWNTGNNVAFSMLYANQGGGWVTDGTSRGGNNAEPNGYFSYQIGMTYPESEDTLGQNADRTTAKNNGYPVSDNIYLVNGSNVTEPFDTSVLDMGGYGLFNTFDGGVYTAGLLNHGLITVTGTDGKTYRVPDYKAETVEYIAVLLRDALRIAQTDANGNYNYNFVRGTANGEQYGYDANGKPMDLASALRKELNVILPATGGKANLSECVDLGDYAELTDADKAGLIGEFSKIKGNIDTFVDAAYYLLMNLYVSDSYNQAQDEYSYLILSNGTLSSGKNAYVFDGGFTTGVAANTANTDAYRNSSQSAIVYNKELDTISMSSALSKDQVYYQGLASTTRFPFLPVTDAEGVYAGETKSPYFLDDGRGVMGVTKEGATFVNRNYNFAMAANGEFVYHYDEDLFFQFEGDDDVYLFINGELVLDIGGAHSITDVSLNVNDYVNWARKVLANPSNYSAQQIARAKKLNLKDGGKYTFDFYYMERHGWGSNCRIVSNIVVTDPALSTDKQAYQDVDVNGDPLEVEYGGIVDITDRIGYSFAITNKGETKLYKLGFKDADIGINLTSEGGLQIYGRPTVKTFSTTAANTAMTITGLNGMVNLDGQTYPVTASGTEITITKAGDHTLTMYQYEPDPSNPVNELYQDASVTIKVGSASYTATVAGIRVSDKDGGHLDPSDLVITVDGYASKENFDNGIPVPTITITGKKDDATQTVAPLTNDELKSFLTSLQDPNGSTDSDPDLTEDEAAANLYAHDGLWQNATVKIGGFYYLMTEAEQEENRFTNTVFTTGYKFKHGTAPLKSQDRHRVYGLGSYAYYQWAGHTVHLDIKTFWDDVNNVYASPDEALYEQVDQINALKTAINGDLTKLKLEITDTSGDPLKDAFNLYSGGRWSTYQNRRVYFSNADGWNKVNVYYWSHTNASMVAWPGASMTSDGTNWYADIPVDADYVIFNNVADGEANVAQTGDLTLMDGYNLYSGGAASGSWSAIDGQLNANSDKHRIYFQNNEDWNKHWTNVYAYWWSDSDTTMSAWPGTAMRNTAADGKSGTWYIDVPVDAEHVIFNNGMGGEGNQTGDLNMPETAYTGTIWDDANHLLDVNFHTPGRHIFYVKVSCTDTSVIEYVVVPVVFYVTSVKDHYIVLDYGLKTDVITPADLMNSDDFLYRYNAADTTDPEAWRVQAEFIGYLTGSNDPKYLGDYSADAFAKHNINRVTYNGSLLSSDFAAEDGTFDLTGFKGADVVYADGKYDLSGDFGMTFQPTDFMDKEYDLWMAFRLHNPIVKSWSGTTLTTSTFTPHAIGGLNTSASNIEHTLDIHNEVQMLKKITVLPATVVYYEDDFAAVDYKDDAANATGSFEHHGAGSGTLTQGINGSTPYGQDHAYQTNLNAQMSGNSMHTVKLSEGGINKAQDVASFKFTGTGFEIISRTNANDSASFYITVQDKDGEVVTKLPVVTEFDGSANNGGTCSHSNHSQGGVCTTCGQHVGHSFPEASSLYSHVLPKEAVYVIFNNGSGSQTADIELKETNGFVADTNGNGSYSITKDADGSWVVTFDNANTNWSAVNIYSWNGDNKFTGEWPGTTLVNNSCTVCGAAYTVQRDYYLIGNINGANCGDVEDWTNVTPYKFVNGKLTVTFTASSYVGVKTPTGTAGDGNPTFDWYWAPQYCTGTTTTLNTSSGEKMFVPAGVEVTFSLAENADGTLTLSYSVPKTGSEKTLYFDNTGYGWSQPHVYSWTGGDKFNGEWPGEKMTHEGGNIWSCQVSGDALEVIFNNGSSGDGNQTGDLSAPVSGSIYKKDSGWETYVSGGGDSGSTGGAVVSGYAIHQVPVVRVDGLTYGEYTVTITGMPTYDLDSLPEDPDNWEISEDGYITGLKAKTTYLYIDGIRIYQPLNAGTNLHYYGPENSAKFVELRSLILQGKAAVAQYVKNIGSSAGVSSIYTGNLSWAENRNPANVNDGTTFVGNQVSGIDEYMLVGPNNETYLYGDASKQAVILYVKEEAAAENHTLQIAARAIDSGLFFGGNSTGTIASLYQGVASGDSYAWKLIDTIQSGTEQYYTIDYAACPKTEDGYYQVALHVRSGMISFTSLKYKGLTIMESGLSEATDLFYQSNGLLELPEAEGQSINWNFRKSAQQMESAVYLDEVEPEQPDNGDNGSTDTGKDDEGENNPATGDVELLWLMMPALLCVAFIAIIYRKKLAV